MNTQKISKYELKNNGSSSETLDSKTVKNSQDQVNTQTVSVSQEKNKEKGWFNFINEKLNEWPLWVRLTKQNEEVNMNHREAKKQKKQKEEKKLAKMALSILPWNEYFQRGPLRPYYCYLHNKQDKMTHFYAMKRSNRDQENFEVQAIPNRELMHWGIEFVIPTQLALQLIRKDLQSRTN